MSVRPLSLLSAPLALAFALGAGERPARAQPRPRVLAQSAPTPVGAPVPGAAPTPVGATPTPFGAPPPAAPAPTPGVPSPPVSVTPGVRPATPIGPTPTTGARPATPIGPTPSAPGRPGDARANAAADADTLEAHLASQFAPTGGLTADEVAQKAVASSYDVRARQAEIDVATASVDQALYAFYPRLALSASYTRLSPITSPPLNLGGGTALAAPGVVVPDGQQATPITDINQLQVVRTPAFVFPVILNNYSLVARLTVPLSDYLLRFSQAYASATRSENAALYNERATRLKAAADAKGWYYQWVSAKLSLVAADQSLTQRRAQLLDTQRTFQAGTASRADVLNAEARVADAELFLERQRNLVTLQEERLRTIMHDTSGRAYEMGEDVRNDPPGAQQQVGALADGYNEALGQRLEVRALDESALSLRESAKVARAGAWPRLDGLGDVTYANPNQRFVPLQERFRATWSVGLQLSWSPNDVPVANASASSFEARAAQTEAQRNTLRDNLRQEVVQAQNGLRESQVAVQTSARSLTAAEESYRVRRELFRNGRATNLEVTDAENVLLVARLNAITARVNLRIALVNLEHSLGRDVKRTAAATP